MFKNDVPHQPSIGPTFMVPVNSSVGNWTAPIEHHPTIQWLPTAESHDFAISHGERVEIFQTRLEFTKDTGFQVSWEGPIPREFGHGRQPECWY